MKEDLKEVEVDNPEYFPDSHVVKEMLEPMVIGTVLCPPDYMGMLLTNLYYTAF